MKQYFWLDQATNGIMRENFTFLNDFLNKKCKSGKIM